MINRIDSIKILSIVKLALLSNDSAKSPKESEETLYPLYYFQASEQWCNQKHSREANSIINKFTPPTDLGLFA